MSAEYSVEEVLNMVTNVRDCAWPADVKPYMVLIEPMLRNFQADCSRHFIAQELNIARHQLRNTVDDVDLALMGVV